MPKLSDITPEQRFFGLFVGESGSGKTCAAASFPKPLEVLDFDGRIRGAWNKSWIPMDGISYESYRPEQKGLINTLEKKFDVMQTAADMMGASPISLPKTQVLDSLTSECFSMIMQSVPLTHSMGSPTEKKRGRYIGITPMVGPEDYGFEANMTYSIISTMRSLPISNVIISAHIVPVWGKEDPDNEYSNTVQIGEKLSVRDKIGANIGIYFDHVFRFRKIGLDTERFTVQFRGGICRTAWDFLPNGEIDITKRNFYEVLMGFVPKEAH